MKVLVIDPGERVGWATARIFEDGSLSVLKHGITALRPFALKLNETFANYDTVIYEQFRLTARGGKTLVGSDMQTAQLVGIIRFLAWINPQVKLVRQTPTQKNGADKLLQHYPDLAERIAGLPAAHDESHDGDALRHLAHFHFFTYAKEPA